MQKKQKERHHLAYMPHFVAIYKHETDLLMKLKFFSGIEVTLGLSWILFIMLGNTVFCV